MRNVRIINIAFDNTETKAEAVPKKEGTKEDKENGGIALATYPVIVVSNLRASLNYSETLYSDNLHLSILYGRSITKSCIKEVILYRDIAKSQEFHLVLHSLAHLSLFA